MSTHDADGETTDYGAIEVPADVAPEEWNTEQRRADLLDRVLAAGSPAAINQTELAQRYGVNQSTVSRDMDHLAEYVEDALGDHGAMQLKAAHDRTVQDLFDAGEEDWRAVRAAWTVVKEWGSGPATNPRIPPTRQNTGEGGGGLNRTRRALATANTPTPTESCMASPTSPGKSR
jgi:DNA-binding transcriptional MocR family regulator